MSGFAAGGAGHKLPHEDRNLELALSPDHAEFLGVLFKKLRGTERSEPMHNSKNEISRYMLAASILSQTNPDKFPQARDSFPN